MRKNIVGFARAEVGQMEESGQGADDQDHPVNINQGVAIKKYLHGKEDLAWCATFVAWVMEQADNRLMKYTLGVADMRNQAKARNAFIGEKGHRPQVGDLLVMDHPIKGAGGHVRIVIAVNEGGIRCVEGNSPKRV